MVLAVGIPALVAAAGTVGVMLWLRTKPDVGTIESRQPQPEPAPGTQAAKTEAAAGAPKAASPRAAPTPAVPGQTAPAVAGSWPGFRGARRDNVSTDSPPLARSWGPQGPPRLWSVQLGEGYAAPCIVNSRVYLLDYDHAARADRLRCWALATGQELWSQAYACDVKRNHGMSRTVPATDGKVVVTLGPKCNVMCCDAQSGQVRWELDLVSQFGATVPDWYAGQCPLIDQGRAILAPGGTALMIAVDLGSGNVVWQTPNPNGWKMTHSSILPISFAGKRQYVYCAGGGVVGVNAADGAVLWQTPDWTVSTANVPTPVEVGEGRLFLCGGYNAGSMLLGLKNAGGTIQPQTVYRLPASTYGSEQQTPVLYQGSLYGTSANKQLVCLGLDGSLKWSSGGAKQFGLGAYMIAGGLLFIMQEGGELVLVNPSPAGYQELARAKVLNGPEAWGPLAIAGGLLLARDLTSMVCLDVRSK
jgi:outer membrane protein assembly factor BamB